MKTVVLLGDSIFDNKAYVQPHEPDVQQQLQTLLGQGSQAVLLAVDGSTTQGIADQLRRLPANPTHLVLSVGGE